MLNIHQLNVFISAAETLNFTVTAKRLHLTQSSVSQIIKTLESQLEVELFKRKARTIRLTDAGNLLLPMAREIVEGSIRAAEQMELAGFIEDKKQYALNIAQAYLNEHGWDEFDIDLLEAAIEAEVLKQFPKE